MRITVAEMPIDIELDNTAFLQDRFSPYASTGDISPQMKIVARVVDRIEPPAGAPIQTIGKVYVYALPDGTYCHCRYLEDTCIQMCRYTPDFSKTDLQVSPKGKLADRALELEYAYTAYDFASRLGCLGGAVLHGSAIAYKGQGIIFSAPSGTGKSTHTALWKQLYTDDVIHVNDDKPALRRNKTGGFTVYGTPWSGKSNLHTNCAVPLRAIVFLKQAPQNSMRRLDLTEGLLGIQSQTVQPYHAPKVGEKIVDFIVSLAQNVPIWELGCTPTMDAVQLVKDTIFGKEDLL